MVKIYLDSHIRLKLSELPARIQRSLRTRCTHRDPVYGKTKAMGYAVYHLSPTLQTYEIIDDELVIWRGCLGDVIRTFKRYDLKYQLIDNRLRLDPVEFHSSIELYDYQKAPVAVMKKRQQTVIRAPCGIGKTEMLLAVAAEVSQPTLVIVWQERQQAVWLERIPKRLGVEPGGVGGCFKKPKLAAITVGLQQSLKSRIDELKGCFGCVLADEVQRHAAKTFSQVINALPAAYRIGASDDERRKDDREFLIYDSFGPIGWRTDPHTGQCDVEIEAIPTDFEVNDDIEWASLINYLVRDPDRNEIILDLAQKEADGGHRVLMWSDRVQHCVWLRDQLLERGVKAGLIIGGSDWKEEAEATEQGLRSGEISVGIGTSVAEQSINIPPLDRGIMTCPSADYPKMTRFKQMRGRLARPYPGKESKLYYLWDRKVHALRRKMDNLRRKYQVKINPIRVGVKDG